MSPEDSPNQARGEPAGSPDRRAAMDQLGDQHGDQHGDLDPATPTGVRCVTSYPARRKFRPGTMFPPDSPGVTGAIDLHCHAHEGGNDALALAKFASECGMGGLVIKTIGKFGMIDGAYRPGRLVDQLTRDLAAWCAERKIAPVPCWLGAVIGQDNEPASVAKVRRQLDDGAVAIWLPVANNAHTLSKVGGKNIWWDRNADPRDHTAPLPWDEALKFGYHMLDARGRLKGEFVEIIRVIVDHGAALFFGHGTHPEIFAVAELLDKLGDTHAVIDHPFSPFINLSLAEMKQLTQAGLYLNFTYDELSPLLGVDPARMYAAIRHVGVDHVTLSSDAGEPLFPNSVECIRLVRHYMAAFGLTADELKTVSTVNPSKVLAKVLARAA
jgi:hypothetical protein